MGVSLWIFLAYSDQYIDDYNEFGQFVWFFDVWFTRMQPDFEVMMASSWSDMICRLVFACGLLQCIEGMKNLLVPVEKHPVKPALVKVTAVMPQGQPSVGRPVASHSTDSSSLFKRATMAFFTVWGLVIVAIHCVPEPESPGMPCQMPVRPWFATRPACALVEIDCYTSQVNGSADSLHESWTVYAPDSIARVVIRHCTHLEIPPILQQYSGLSSLKIYNSTIVSWQEEAALTSQSHPQFRMVILGRVDLPNGALPPGLVSPDFPPTTRSFVSAATNLIFLPSDLHVKWPVKMALAFDYSLLDSIPDVVIQLNPLLLSMAGCPITDVQPEVFELPSLVSLYLGETPLARLPPHVEHLSPSLGLVFLLSTNISLLPAWMDPILVRTATEDISTVNAYDSLYCRQLELINAGELDSFETLEDGAIPSLVMDVSTPARFEFASRAVRCIMDLPGYYTVWIEDFVSGIYV